MFRHRSALHWPSHLTTGLVFCATLSLYILTAGGSLSSTDAVVTFNLTKSLVEQRSIALSHNVLGLEANRGIDGRFYSQFGIGQSIYNIPFYLAGREAARWLPPSLQPPDMLPKAAVALGSTVAAAAAVTLIWILAVALTADQRASLLCAMSAAIAAPLWPYSKFGFSTPLITTILAGIQLLCWVAGRRGSIVAVVGAGLLLGFGWLTRHELVLFVIPFAAFLWFEGRRNGRPPSVVVRQVLVFLATTAVGGFVWTTYNLTRFGHPFSVGYVPEFSGIGYLAFLFAPAGSIFLFCPIVIVWILGVFREKVDRPTVVLLLAAPLIMAYAFYGALDDWPGGRSYGPRYLVPSLVLLAPGLAFLLRRHAFRPSTALTAIMLAAFFQLPGVLVDYSRVSVSWARTAHIEDVQDRNWRLRLSPLILNAREAIRALPRNVKYLSGQETAPPLRPTHRGDREFGQQFSFSLDFWWMYLVYLRIISPGAALVLASGFVSLTALTAGWAWMRAAPAEEVRRSLPTVTH